MNTQKLYDLKDMMCHELDSIANKGEMSAGDLEAVHKLTSSIKNIGKIIMLDEAEGYSGANQYSRDSGSYGGNYGSSYRGRQRDSRGRYSGNDSGRSYRYSRDGIRDKLSELMDEAGTDREREALRRCMESME